MRDFVTNAILVFALFGGLYFSVNNLSATDPIGVCAHGTCSNTCGSGVYPMCGTGKCDAKAGCEQACNNGCSLITSISACECMGMP